MLLYQPLKFHYWLTSNDVMIIKIKTVYDLYSPAVAVLVIFKVDFTVLIHNWGFWSFAPYFNEMPTVLQYNRDLLVKHPWIQTPTINISTHHLFFYLKEEGSKEVHVVSVNCPSIPDSSTPQVQTLCSVHGSFSPVWRHQQVTLFTDQLSVFRIDADPNTKARDLIPGNDNYIFYSIRTPYWIPYFLKPLNRFSDLKRFANTKS